jgi:hypothetical protein
VLKNVHQDRAVRNAESESNAQFLLPWVRMTPTSAPSAPTADQRFVVS